MKLCFDSIEEVKAFVAALKGTRGGKKGDDDDALPGQAPAPLAPPAPAQSFNPAPPPARSAAGKPVPPPQSIVDPVVTGLVQRIVARIDGAIASSQLLRRGTVVVSGPMWCREAGRHHGTDQDCFPAQAGPAGFGEHLRN